MTATALRLIAKEVISGYPRSHCFPQWRGARQHTRIFTPARRTESEKPDRTFHFLLFPSPELREDDAEEKY
jgi:hypothetical protein